MQNSNEPQKFLTLEIPTLHVYINTLVFVRK